MTKTSTATLDYADLIGATVTIEYLDRPGCVCRITGTVSAVVPPKDFKEANKYGRTIIVRSPSGALFTRVDERNVRAVAR